MSFRVRLTREAEADLERLFDVVLETELTRDGDDLARAANAIAVIQAGIATLAASPFTCRKAGANPFLRELIIPVGSSGHVALFEIVGAADVVIAAVRHRGKTTTTESPEGQDPRRRRASLKAPCAPAATTGCPAAGSVPAAGCR